MNMEKIEKKIGKLDSLQLIMESVFMIGPPLVLSVLLIMNAGLNLTIILGILALFVIPIKSAYSLGRLLEKRRNRKKEN